MSKKRTIPSLRTKTNRAIFGVCAVLVAIAAPLQFTNGAVYADQYDDQMNAIRQQVNQYQAQADQLHKQATSLQSAVDALTAEVNTLQAQLNLSQAQYDKLTNDIAVNKIKLQDNQKALGDIIADLYVDNSVSPLEMLASSKNISDYMDKNTYQTSVKDKLNSTIQSIQTLKAQLESDQKSVEKVLNDQRAQQATLTAKQAEQQQLLSETQGNEAAYQQKVADGQAQMAAVAAQQRAALARVTGGGMYNYGSVGSFQFRNYSGNTPCGGGYPWCYGLDSGSDMFDLYYQECVSYAAWGAYTLYGKDVQKFVSPYSGSGDGSAYQWPQSTQRMGAYTDHTPEVGSVAILPPTPNFSPIGHAMLVTSVEGGGWVGVSQYNFGGTGEYSTMDIQASGVVFIHFQNR